MQRSAIFVGVICGLCFCLLSEAQAQIDYARMQSVPVRTYRPFPATVATAGTSHFAAPPSAVVHNGTCSPQGVVNRYGLVTPTIGGPNPAPGMVVVRRNPIANFLGDVFGTTRPVTTVDAGRPSLYSGQTPVVISGPQERLPVATPENELKIDMRNPERGYAGIVLEDRTTRQKFKFYVGRDGAVYARP